MLSSPAVKDNCYSREAGHHLPCKVSHDQLTCRHRYVSLLRKQEDPLLLSVSSSSPSRRPTSSFCHQETHERDLHRDQTPIPCNELPDEEAPPFSSHTTKYYDKRMKKPNRSPSITTDVAEEHLIVGRISDSIDISRSREKKSVSEGNRGLRHRVAQNIMLSKSSPTSSSSSIYYWHRHPLLLSLLFITLIMLVSCIPMPSTSLSSNSDTTNNNDNNQRSTRIVVSQDEFNTSRRSRVGDHDVTGSAFYVNNSESNVTSSDSGHSRYSQQANDNLYFSTTTLTPRSTIHFSKESSTTTPTRSTSDNNDYYDASFSSAYSSRTTRRPSSFKSSSIILFPTTTSSQQQPDSSSSEGSSSLYPANVYTSNNNNDNLETTVSESYGDRLRNKVLTPEVDPNGQPIGCPFKPGQTFCESVDNYPE